MKNKLIKYITIYMAAFMLCGCGKTYTTEISLSEIAESTESEETGADAGNEEDEAIDDTYPANDDIAENSAENDNNQNVNTDDSMASDNPFHDLLFTIKLALEKGDDQDLSLNGLDSEIRFASSIGYAEYDYDGDGDTELIIGEDEGARTFVWAIYEKYPVYDGWNTAIAISGYARNRYYLMDEYRLANEWSAGAEDSGVEIYKLDGAGGMFPEQNVPSDYESHCLKLQLQPIN